MAARSIAKSPNKARLVMRSVPRAVATGSQSTPQSSLSDHNPVAIASGTDLTVLRENFGTSEFRQRGSTKIFPEDWI